MRIIGLTGQKRVGKDTVAMILCEELKLQQIAFADPIREMLNVLPIAEECKERKLEPIKWLDKSYTELCQSLGTGWGRDMVKRSIWIEVADYRYRMADLHGMAGVVFSDIRYEDEAEYVTSIGGEIYEVYGPRGVAYNDHPSERALSSRFLSGNIPNNKTLPELRKYLIGRFY